MDLIKELTKSQIKEMPEVLVGDTVKVHVKVKEGARERIQVYEGIVIAKKHGGIEETITVACPTVSAWRRSSPCTPPRLRRSRLCVTALCAARSSTICVTGLARPPRFARSSNQRKRRPAGPPAGFFCMSEGVPHF